MSNVAGPLDLQLLGENPFKDLGTLRVGFFPGDELGIREPETPGAPLMVVLRDILHDHRGWPITHPLPFNIGIEAERAVVGTTSLRLNPNGLTQIFPMLRENRGQIGQVDRQRIEQGWRTLLALSNGLALSENIALVFQRLAVNDLENGIFALPKNPDGALREFQDELIGKGSKGSPTDHDLRLRELLRNQPGVGKCRPDMAVVAVELLHPRKRGGNPLEWIARKVEVKRMFQRRVSLVRRKDLNIAPGKTDEVRLKLGSGIANGTDPLAVREKGKIKDALPHIRFTAMNKISEIGHADGIDLLTREEDVEDGVHNIMWN